MGNDICSGIHDDIFLTIFTFLNDKNFMMCSLLNKRLFKLTRNNLIWHNRILRRFYNIVTKDTIESRSQFSHIEYSITCMPDNCFKQYIRHHNHDYFVKHLIDPITRDMIEATITNNNIHHCELISKYFNYRFNKIILIKSIIDTPIKLKINVEASKKGMKKIKTYNISGNKKFTSIHNKWFLIDGSKHEHLSIHQLFNMIIDLMNQNYYIAKHTINEKVGNELLNKSLAVIM